MVGVKQYQVAFYDSSTSKCYDEAFYSPDKLDVVSLLMRCAAENNDEVKIFVHFDDGSIFEFRFEESF